MSPVAKDVESFLAALPGDVRAALEALRATIRAAVPDAEESIAYGVPAFKHKGRPLVSMGAGKSNCSFYVQSPAVMQAHASDLRGYETAKGTVHFLPDKPLPAALVRKLVEARLAENEAALAARRIAKR